MEEKMEQKELIKEINKQKDTIFRILKANSGYSQRDLIESFSGLVEEYLNKTISTKIPNILRIVSIKEPIVSTEIAKYCLYSDGYYYGYILKDTNGNIYPNLEAAKSTLGENILCGSSTYFVTNEYRYLPEIDMVVNIETTIHTADSTNAITYRDCRYKLINRESCMWTVGASYQTSQSTYNDYPNKSLMKAMKEMHGFKSSIMNVGGNSYIALDTHKNIKRFFNYKAKMEKKPGKVQSKIDELIDSYELKPVVFKELMPHETTSISNKAVVEKLSDELCVVRWVYKYEDEVIDGLRIYVEGQNYYACKRNNRGEYIKININTLSGKNFISNNTEEIDLGDLTGTRLQYFSSIVNNIPSQYRTMLLIMSMLNPRVEQMLKCGFEKHIYKLIGNDIGKLKDPMKEIQSLIHLNPDGKDINKWLGISKYQKERFLQVADELNENVFTLIGSTKDIFETLRLDDGDYTIANYKNEDFEEVLKVASWLGRRTQNGNYCHIKTDEIVDFLRTAKRCDNASMTNTKRLVYNLGYVVENICEYMPYRLRTYIDYLYMYSTIRSENSRMRIYLSSYEDVSTYHDAAVALYNLKRNQYLNEAFVRNLKKVERLSYEKDDSEFVVVIPEKADDLGEEGAALRHCVKSYIDKVANGMTNIVFIRRKNAKDTPFFTVEVDNDKTIRQAHGFCNCNANTVEGLTEFIEKWAKEKKLKVGTINIVR